jgi:hypothetical protein
MMTWQRGRDSGADMAALKRAIVIVMQHPGRARELADLILQRGWRVAAKIAAFDCQCRALDLKPWQMPPCAGRVRGDKSPAGRLLKRMAERGVSRWAPDPLRAISEASPPARAQSGRRGAGAGSSTSLEASPAGGG